ncbi:MAG TPA: alpha/beta fold hydrolase [Rudaea sp.]|nr:alpha/beta fold hydrolase [Rudaea sp.]
MNTKKLTMVATPDPGAPLRLFCFPYAGAGASIFRAWSRDFAHVAEVVGIQLPGRENRFSEPRYTRLGNVVDALVDALGDFADKPFFFFGHSVGALIAFELTRALERHRRAAPFHLAVAGMRAPQLPRRREPLYELDDASFVAKIREFNGIPREVLEHAELMQLVTPLLRDDFAICDTYRYADGPPLRCPLTAFSGDADPDVTVDELEAWSPNTAAEFEYYMFPGDHFFIHPNRPRIVEILRLIATRQARAPEPALA